MDKVYISKQLLQEFLILVIEYGVFGAFAFGTLVILILSVVRKAIGLIYDK